MLHAQARRGSLTWVAGLALAGCPAHVVVAPPDEVDSSEGGEEGADDSPDPTSASPTTGAQPTSTDTGVIDGGSGGGSGDTTGGPGGCGDGVVDGEAGEQCDLGFAINSDAGPCT